MSGPSPEIIYQLEPELGPDEFISVLNRFYAGGKAPRR